MHVAVPRMNRWFVGKVRFNDQVTKTPLVSMLRDRFPPAKNFDMVEIYNASIANDPSPPSKALAVIHRSSLNNTNFATTVFHKCLDYNNRDFYIWETQRLVDTIAQQWLTSLDGGIQLTVNRNDATNPTGNKLNRLLRNLRGVEVDQRTTRAFADSKSTHGHSLWKNVYEARFFRLPWGKRDTLVPIDKEFACTTIAGLSDTSSQIFGTDRLAIRLLHASKLNSILHAQILSEEDNVPVHEYTNLIQSLMREHKCVEGVLYSETPFKGHNCNHSFSIHKRHIGKASVNLTDEPLCLGEAFLV